jgi:hypothetical protein
MEKREKPKKLENRNVEMTLRFAFYSAQLAVILCRYHRGKKVRAAEWL